MARKQKNTAKDISNGATRLSPGAMAIASKGRETQKVILKYFSESEEQSLFSGFKDDDLEKVANAFKEGWTDQEAAKLLEEYSKLIGEGKKIELSQLSKLILNHRNEEDAANLVLYCLNVDPPEQIRIIRLLSRAGSQKLVFLGTWSLTQRQVVLKRPVGPPEITNRILEREQQSSPLSLRHNNIMETHFLKNKDGESFLVEECVEVINDDWRSDGIFEASNLLYDIASGLSYLHENLALVHGDVKPDNIGKRRGNYILLDFGICRPTREFLKETSATGSLRTRAPELIENAKYEDPTKVDVWALGATIYNSFAGRFPLLDEKENPPRISNPDDREKFEHELSRRVREEWERRVVYDKIPEPMKNIISLALERDVTRRISAKDLIEEASNNLSACLRPHDIIGNIAPLQELEQLSKYLPEKEILELMPISQKHSLSDRLKDLESYQGFTKSERKKINDLKSRIG